jgi:hypothetical protein
VRYPRGPEPTGPVARIEPSRRPGGGVRWMTALLPGAATAYVGAVWQVAHSLEPRLGPRVLANRVAGAGLALEAWPRAHGRWRRHLRAGLADPQTRAVATADVRDCYASVTPGALVARLRTLGVAPHRIHALLRLLERFGEDGVRGLPVGPEASAVLANLVLQAVDDELAAADIRYLRWVDDVVVFARGTREAARALGAIERALDGLGLRLNEAKCIVMVDRADAQERLGLRTQAGRARAWAPSPGAGSSVR